MIIKTAVVNGEKYVRTKDVVLWLLEVQALWSGTRDEVTLVLNSISKKLTKDFM